MSELPSLTPPETLKAPEAVETITPEQSHDMVQIPKEKRPELDKKAEEFVNGLLAATYGSDEFKQKVDSLHNIGANDIRASASMSNRMLERPMNAMQDGVFDPSSGVSRGLVDLRRTVEDLDPSRQGALSTPRKILGILPFGRRIEDYFMRYQSAQSHLNAIIESLYRSQDELRKDNAAIEQEKVNLWNTMQRLRQYVYVARSVDEALTRRVAEIETRDPDKARVIKEELLFAVRQRVTDILTQLAVSVQGYMALDLVRRNNLELIKGVDRATTTTVSALRTAVIVSQALTNQKLVLDQINALNSTTSNLIEATSRLMRDNSVEIARQGSESTVDIEKLKMAFSNIYSALDQISEYKIKALGNFSQTIDTLQTEVDTAHKRLDRERIAVAREATKDIKSTDPNDISL